MKRSRSKQVLGCVQSLVLAAAFLAGFAAQAASIAASSAEPIPAEEAFQSQARYKDAKTIEVEFKIADGYYLYRKRFQFAPEATGLKFGVAKTPAGKMKQDATFGRVETYRKSVRVLLPIAAVDKEIHFKVTSQGCADVGVCYPPMKQYFVLKAGDTIAVNALPDPTLPSFAKPASASVPVPGSVADLIKRTP
jgi:thioredoxin:protein disulfide reductase